MRRGDIKRHLRRAELSRDLDALTGKVSPSQIERRKEATRSKLRSMRERVMGTAQDTRQGMASAGSGAGGAVSDAASGAADTITGSAQGAKTRLEHQAEGVPLAGSVIAFGAGWLISSLMPASDKEERLVHQLVESTKDSPLVDEARMVGHDMADSRKESASEAAEEVKNTAQESAETVKEEGQYSAESVQQRHPTGGERAGGRAAPRNLSVASRGA